MELQICIRGQRTLEIANTPLGWLLVNLFHIFVGRKSKIKGLADTKVAGLIYIPAVVNGFPSPQVLTSIYIFLDGSHPNCNCGEVGNLNIVFICF